MLFVKNENAKGHRSHREPLRSITERKWPDRKDTIHGYISTMATISAKKYGEFNREKISEYGSVWREERKRGSYTILQHENYSLNLGR